MMSTSRANSRAMKDKTKNSTQQSQTKSDGPPNIKPTAEQLRLAQIIKTDDDQDPLIKELMDMTQKSEEACALALHDCQNDPSKAVMMLLEGDGDQGEWKEQGKKKKRMSNQAQNSSKSDSAVDHIIEMTDNRPERSRDRDGGDRFEKGDFPPRRGRRSNGGPPPRLARGRGRERGNFGDRNHDDGDNDKENGVAFFGRDRNGERGRGRGRGGQSGRRGRGGPRTFRGGQGQRFDKGPHIDTWTNETAENAEKETPGWGETWTEDWSEDTWTGNLTETKVFTATSVKSVDEPTQSSSPPLNDTGTPSLGQRLDVGSLLPKLANENSTESYIHQYNQQATESIKNSIGIGSDSSRQNYSSLQTPAQSLVNSMSASQSHPPPSSWAASSPVGTPTSSATQACVGQRPKPQKSKLPPPSKIPSSAVEMPGHQVMPHLDVEFGADFESDSAVSFEFASGEPLGTSSSFSTSATTSSTTASVSNHVSQPATAPAESPVMTTPMLTSAGTQPRSSLEQTPRSVFQSSGYPAPKIEGQPTLAPSAKTSPPDNLAFPPPQKEQKAAPLMPSQLASQSGVPLNQGSLPSSTSDTANLASFVQSSSSYNTSGYKNSAIVSSQAYSSTHTTNSQVGSYQSQYQTSPKSFSSSGNQYPSGQSQYQGSQAQYPAGQSQFPSGQTQYQGYQGGVASFQGQSNPSSSLYQASVPASSYQSQNSSYHVRDSQASSGQSGTGAFQNQSAGLSSPTSQSQSYGSQSFSSSGHQSSLQGSSMSGNKLGDGLTKLTLKDPSMDSHSTSQYDHSTTSTTSSGLTTTSTGSLATGTITVAASSISSAVSSSSMRTPSTGLSNPSTKAPPNLPPGVPLMGTPSYILGQPPFYGVQQPLYGFDEMMLQQRLQPLTGNYYDISQFPVPTTMTGRDAPTLANVPYSGSADNSKLPRVEAQSPNPTTQQQSGHSAHQQPLNFLPYGFYYPNMMPGAAPGFQYPQVYPMPPVTNTAHAGSTASSQFQKSFSHGYTGKGYDDLTQGQDFTKTGYGASQSQNKGSVGTRSGSSAELAATGYGKSHPQAFEKPGFHGGTPPPFNLPLAAASQAAPMGAPANPYAAGFVPMMTHQPHQPHSQMTLHHPMQQDSTTGSSRVGSGQGSNMGKPGGNKGYGAYWNN